MKVCKYFLIIYVTLIISISCEDVDPLSIAISKKVLQGEGTIVYIAELTNFDWDNLYIFKPYDNRDIVHETVGIKFLEANELSIGLAESENFFVFVKNNKVITYFIHLRKKGDFSYIANSVFTESNARFIVDRNGYLIQI